MDSAHSASAPALRWDGQRQPQRRRAPTAAPTPAPTPQDPKPAPAPASQQPAPAPRLPEVLVSELPPDDPASTVNRANLAKTCGQCHHGVAETFAAVLGLLSTAAEAAAAAANAAAIVAEAAATAARAAVVAAEAAAAEKAKAVASAEQHLVQADHAAEEAQAPLGIAGDRVGVFDASSYLREYDVSRRVSASRILLR